MAIITGTAGADTLNGGSGDDQIEGLDGDDRLEGGTGADIISGGGGDDEINDHDVGWDADFAIDRLDGGDGDDEIWAGSNDSAAGGDGFDQLVLGLNNQTQGTTIDLAAMWAGGAGSNGSGSLTGFEQLIWIIGTHGADLISLGTIPGADNYQAPFADGRAGDDQLRGGDQRDSLAGGEGADLLFGLGGDDWLWGNGENDRLEGGEGDDMFDGGPGADVLVGGAGSDTYQYNHAGFPGEDQIVEDADAAGIDRILIRVSEAPVTDAAFAGVRNVELVELIAQDDLPGTEFILGAHFAAAGFGTLIASADIDASAVASGLDILISRPVVRSMTVTSGSGDDVFRIDRNSVPPVAQTYRLDGGAGLDTLRFDTSEEAGLLGTLYAGARVVISGVERVSLGAGSPAVAVDGAPDVAGAVQRYWLILTDDSIAAGGRLTIDGGALRTNIAFQLGADGEIGGTGDDADLIVSDRLIVDGTQLTAGHAIDVLAGATDDSLFGGADNDTLLGGAGVDELYGSEGDDFLFGGAGNDLMLGDAGNDVLDGRGGQDIEESGVDRMEGGLGDDVYLVDAAASLPFEYFGQGTDEVRTMVSYTLPDAVEILTLAGGAHIGGSGNAQANRINGNGGNNRLDGKGGADMLAGGKGHDTYVVDHAGDTVIEDGSSGNDRIESSITFALPVHVEKLILTGTFGYDGRGNAAANSLTGNAGRNFLNGGRGDDVIAGGAGDDQLMGNLGRDSLRGGAGDDRFYFNAAPGSADADRILDFSAADDSLWLQRSVFTRAGPAGTLAAAAFHQGTAAADAGDRILYDAATGSLFYDADGSGAAAALLFATVTAGMPLTHADFVIYG